MCVAGFEVDTLRTLAQHQDSISTSDLSHLLRRYQGPPEGPESLFFSDSIHLPTLCNVDDVLDYPLLATALKKNVHSPEWTPLIRKLLRRGCDVHAPVRRRYACSGTPLDELFALSTPFESQVAADDWLKLLASEGYDVKAYLEKEKALHASQSYFTYPRQLCFELDRDSPTVHWERWINPDSSASLLREEFKHGLISMAKFRLERDNWEESWPYDGLDVRHWPYAYTRPAKPRKQERAERRMQKKAKKLARANRKHNHSRMPGAWPV